MRKIPVQPRAKARVESILDAAETMIIANGVSNLTMEGIAEAAGVSIGSLYQYFQSRDEIFQQLSRRYYKELDELLAPYLDSVETISSFIVGIEQTIRICWDYTINNPGFRTLFFDVAAWEVMREIDWQDTQEHARRIADALQPLLPRISNNDLLAFGMIIGDSAASTARMAARFPDLKERIFAQFIQLISNHCFGLSRIDMEQELRASRSQRRAPNSRKVAVTEKRPPENGQADVSRLPRTRIKSVKAS